MKNECITNYYVLDQNKPSLSGSGTDDAPYTAHCPPLKPPSPTSFGHWVWRSPPTVPLIPRVCVCTAWSHGGSRSRRGGSRLGRGSRCRRRRRGGGAVLVRNRSNCGGRFRCIRLLSHAIAAVGHFRGGGSSITVGFNLFRGGRDGIRIIGPVHRARHRVRGGTFPRPGTGKVRLELYDDGGHVVATGTIAPGVWR